MRTVPLDSNGRLQQKIWERLHPQTVDAFGGCFQTQPPLGSVNTRLGGG